MGVWQTTSMSRMHIAKTHQWGFPPGTGLPQIDFFAVSLCDYYSELIETESATALYAGAGGAGAKTCLE